MSLTADEREYLVGIGKAVALLMPGRQTSVARLAALVALLNAGLPEVEPPPAGDDPATALLAAEFGDVIAARALAILGEHFHLVPRE